MELLFWKTSRDAIEIVEGYGTQAATAKQKKAFWSGEVEEKLTNVFQQVRMIMMIMMSIMMMLC